jgi:predicted dienelactone hydrolase
MLSAGAMARGKTRGGKARRRAIAAGAGGALLAAALAAAGLALVRPRAAPGGPQSARLLEPGPYAVGTEPVVLVDAARPTAPNADFAGAPSRSFAGAVWYPARARPLEALRLDSPPPAAREGAPFPALLYSHGFMSWYSEGRYLAEQLASRGYVVLSVSYPLTSRGSPGGPRADDLASQPADVSFLLDSLLGWSRDPRHRLFGRVDPERIALAGLSLGGMTTTLAAFHPRLRDPRVRAAVSIAGPSALFASRFFATADVPFLMIAGDIDAAVDYASNAARLRERAPRAGLVTLLGASHAGFADISARLLRFARNPDSFGCRASAGRRPPAREEGGPRFPGLGGPEDGIEEPPGPAPRGCDRPELPEALRPIHQQMLAQLAVQSFLESILARDPETRRASARFLREAFPAENPEVRVELPPLGG